jgi:hypothetical protein
LSFIHLFFLIFSFAFRVFYLRSDVFRVRSLWQFHVRYTFAPVSAYGGVHKISTSSCA